MPPKARGRSPSQSSSGSGSRSGSGSGSRSASSEGTAATNPVRKGPANKPGVQRTSNSSKGSSKGTSKGKGKGNANAKQLQRGSQEVRSNEDVLLIKAEEFMKELGNASKEASRQTTAAMRDRLNMRARISLLKEELTEKRVSLEDTLAEHQFLEDDLSNSLNESRELQERHAEAKRTILNMKGQLAALRDDRDQLFKHVAAMNDENREIDDKRANLFKELFAHRQKLSSATMEQASVRTQLNTLLKEKAQLQQHCDALERSSKVLRRKLEEAEMDKSDARAQVTDLTKAKVHLESEIGTLDRDRSQLREKCGIITHDINSRQGKMGKVSQEYRQLLATVKKMEDQNRLLHKKVLAAEAQQKEVMYNTAQAEAARKELESRMNHAVHGTMHALNDNEESPNGLRMSMKSSMQNALPVTEEEVLADKAQKDAGVLFSRNAPKVAPAETPKPGPPRKLAHQDSKVKMAVQKKGSDTSRTGSSRNGGGDSASSSGSGSDSESD